HDVGVAFIVPVPVNLHDVPGQLQDLDAARPGRRHEERNAAGQIPLDVEHPPERTPAPLPAKRGADETSPHEVAPLALAKFQFLVGQAVVVKLPLEQGFADLLDRIVAHDGITSGDKKCARPTAARWTRSAGMSAASRPVSS